jgi:hypothetical protein
MTIMVEPKRCTSFDEAWTEADRIQGWLTEFEARMLFEFACQVPDDQVIVEVGCYRGKSTVLLANVGRAVLTVDPMFTDLRRRRLGPEITEEDVVALRRNLASHENVTWIRRRVEKYGLPEATIGLLYIDGEHVYPHPKEDFQHFYPRIARRGVAMFHDYQLPDVHRSVALLAEQRLIRKIGGAGSLICCRVERP